MGILKILRDSLTRVPATSSTKERERDPTEACKACPVETLETLMARTGKIGCEGIMADLLQELKDEDTISYLLSTPRRIIVNVILLLLNERSALGLSLKGAVKKADLRRLGNRNLGFIGNKMAKRAVGALRTELQKKFQRTPPAYLGAIKEFLGRVDALTQKSP